MMVSLASGASYQNEVIDNYFKSYPGLKHSIITQKNKEVGCSSPEVKTKLPIRASSRWVLKIVCPGGKKRNVLVRVQERQSVYEAIRPIVSGATLSSHDFKKIDLWMDRRVPTLSVSPIGYTARRYIKKGRRLQSQDVEPFYLIKRGDEMSLKLIKGSLSITIPVLAESGGNIGDKIHFKNLKTGKIVTGKVVSEDQAEYEKK